ncbi:hypothetical protein RYH80_12720 [Halobaculum sp. MBLA0147]|uniref:hypothetical protein n=1 Tax=Halobaculum sp. MBLA0147 TaxID=3079934 RepID=UPI003525CA78
MRREGDHWSIEYQDGVVVGRFHEEMPMEAFDYAGAAYGEIVDRYEEDVVASADLVNITDPFSKDAFEVWEAAAQESARLPNFQRAALCAERIKAMSLKAKYDIEGAEIATFDDFERAIEWARHGEATTSR